MNFTWSNTLLMQFIDGLIFFSVEFFIPSQHQVDFNIIKVYNSHAVGNNFNINI